MHDLRSHLCAKACDPTWSVVGWTCQGHSAHFGLEIKCQIVGLCRSLTFRLSAAFPELRRIHKAVSCMISKDGVISCCLTFSLNSFVLRFRSVNSGGLHASRSEEATGEAERCVVHDWQSCDLGNTKPKPTKKKHEMTLSTVDMPSCHHGWRGHGIHWIHTFPPIHTFHVSFEKETFTLSLLSSSFHIFRVSEFKGSTRHNFSSCLIWSVWSGNVTVSVRFLSHTPLEHRSAAMKTKKDEDSKTSGIPSFCRIDVSSEWNDYLPDLPGLSRVSDFSSCDLLSDIFFMLSKAAISVPGQAGRCDFNAAQLTEVCFAESFFFLHTFFWGFWCWHNSQTVPLPWSRMAGENIQQLTLHAAWSAANDPQQWLEVGTPNCENWCQFGWNN